LYYQFGASISYVVLAFMKMLLLTVKMWRLAIWLKYGLSKSNWSVMFKMHTAVMKTRMEKEGCNWKWNSTSGVSLNRKNPFYTKKRVVEFYYINSETFSGVSVKLSYKMLPPAGVDPNPTIRLRSTCQ
jgi:hypothetical protein